MTCDRWSAWCRCGLVVGGQVHLGSGPGLGLGYHHGVGRLPDKVRSLATEPAWHNASAPSGNRCW
jgi:hypothetical protein